MNSILGMILVYFDIFFSFKISLIYSLNFSSAKLKGFSETLDF